KEKINLKTHTDGRAISPGEISFVKSLPLDEKLAVLKYYLDPAIIERQIIKDVKDAKESELFEDVFKKLKFRCQMFSVECQQIEHRPDLTYRAQKIADKILRF